MPQLTGEDIQKLRQISKHGKNDPVDSETDITEQPANRHGKTLSIRDSAGLVLYATENSNSQAAERFGVSKRTVERHRSYWLNNDDSETVELTKTRSVDDRLCGAMRAAAETGVSLSELADRHGLAKSTVQHHVSESTSQPCSHNIEVRVPRVNFKHGGKRGSPNRRRDSQGRFSRAD